MKLRFFHTTDYNVQGTEVFPFGKKIFSQTLQENEVFHRLKNDDKYIFENRKDRFINSNDFDLLISIENNPIDRLKTRYIVVERYCEGVWSLYHIGKFTMNDADFDLDKCNVSVKVETVDKYTCLIENKDDKFNMLSVSPIISTTAINDIPYIFLVCRNDCSAIPCGVPDPTLWRLFHEECTPILPGTGIWNEVGLLGGANSERNVQGFKFSGNFGAFSSTLTNPGIRSIYGYNLLTSTRINVFNPTLSTTIFGFDIYNDIVIYAIPSAVINSTVFQKNLTTGITTTLFTEINCTITKIFFGGSNKITYTNNFGLLRVNGILVITSSFVTEVNSFGDYVCYYLSVPGRLYLYKISTITTITIDTIPSASLLQMEGDYIVYRRNSLIISYKISTTISSVISTDAGGSTFIKIANNKVAFRETTLGLKIYDLLTNTFVVVGGTIFTSPNDCDFSDKFLTWNENTNIIKYYSIATATTTIINGAFNSTFIKITNDNIVYENNLTFHDYDTTINAEVFTHAVENPTSLTASNGYVGLGQERTNPTITVNKAVVVYKVAITNINPVRVWYQEQKVYPCLAGIPNPPLGGSWVLVSNSCSLNGTSLWKRYPISTPSSIGTIVHGTCSCGISGCTPIAPIGNTNYLLSISDCSLINNISYWLQTIPNIVYSRNRYLIDVIELLVSSICPEISEVKSDFFQWNPNIISPLNYVTNDENHVNLLTIAQKSDIISPYSSEPATIGNVTFSMITSWFKIMFNVYWYVDNGTLYFEHISNIQRNVGLDLTVGKFKIWTDRKNSYGYAKAKMPRTEKFKFMEQSNADFVGFPIEYKDSFGNWLNSVNTDSQEHAVENLTTDISFIQSGGQIALEGFVMFANKFTLSGLFIRNDVGILSLVNSLNSTLGFASLHDKYLRYLRVLLFGFMNNVFTNFVTAIRIKEQDKLLIPLCCEDTFTAEDLVTTNLGLGEVDEATFDFENDKLELKIKY